MRSALREPLVRFNKETAWLLTEFIRSGRLFSTDRHGQLACEMVVIRMHDAWARFCRDVVITSAIGNTVTLGGTQVVRPNPSLKDGSTVVAHLLGTYKKRKYEPKWGDVTECLDAAQRLAITNFSTVSASLGANNSPAEQIRHVRNYYAHRKGGSALLATGTNLFSKSTHPDVRELLNYTAGGEMAIESWVNGLRIVATATVQ